MSPTAMLFVFFVVFLLLHIPIGYCLGLSAMLTLLLTDLMPLSFMVQSFVAAANSFPLLAIPFFVLAGDLMLQGGISQRLVDLGRALFGHLTGALSIICVFCCAIFAALSGSGPATVAAIGGLLIPSMIEEDYDPAFAGVISATAGTLGPIIPPSIVFAIYGVACGVSISDMFMAGFLPGLSMALALAFVAWRTSKKRGFGIKRERSTPRQCLSALNKAKMGSDRPADHSRRNLWWHLHPHGSRGHRLRIRSDRGVVRLQGDQSLSAVLYFFPFRFDLRHLPDSVGRRSGIWPYPYARAGPADDHEFH